MVALWFWNEAVNVVLFSLRGRKGGQDGGLAFTCLRHASVRKLFVGGSSGMMMMVISMVCGVLVVGLRETFAPWKKIVLMVLFPRWPQMTLFVGGLATAYSMVELKNFLPCFED